MIFYPLKRARPSPLNDAVNRKLILKLDPSERFTASSSPGSMDMNMDSVEDQDLPEVTSIGTYVKVVTSTFSVVSCSQNANNNNDSSYCQ